YGNRVALSLVRALLARRVLLPSPPSTGFRSRLAGSTLVPDEDLPFPWHGSIPRVALIRPVLNLTGNGEPQGQQVFRVHPQERGVVRAGMLEGGQEPQRLQGDDCAAHH